MAGKSKSNRREFLRGQSALQAFGDLILSALPSAEGEGPRRKATSATRSSAGPDHYLLHVGRRAMACEFQIFFNAGQYRQATEVALEVLDLVEKIEDELTFFRDTSRLSRINQSAARHAVEVDPGLFEILDLACVCTRRPGGPSISPPRRCGKCGGSPGGRRDARRGFARPGQDPRRQSMGGTGSAAPHGPLPQAGDSAESRQHREGVCPGPLREHLHGAGIEHFLIHGGSSSVLACGAQGSTGEGSPGDAPASWIVGLPHPLRPDRRLGEIRLFDRSLGTSGSQAQSFWHQGRRYGHIFDPRTGWPAQNVLTATAIAPSAMLADALSTAFYVMRAGAGARLLPHAAFVLRDRHLPCPAAWRFRGPDDWAGRGGTGGALGHGGWVTRGRKGEKPPRDRPLVPPLPW